VSFQRGAECPAAVEVERHSAGEQSPFRAHIESCSNCGAYVEELRAASVAFAKQRPAEMFLKQVARRKEQAPARRSWIFGLVGAIAAASLAMVLVPELIATLDEGPRLKGGSVEVYFKRGDAEPVRLVEGATLKPDDVLRFRYRGAQPASLAIIEKDQNGTVTVFAPFGGTRSVVKNADEFLADAVAVDATPGAAALFIFGARSTFDLAHLIAAIRASQAPVCDSCSLQEVLHYKKVP
jgi:hypothetical protein